MKKITISGLIFLLPLFSLATDIPHPIFANPEVRSNDNFVKIKAGSFQMGSPSTEKGRHADEKLHAVTITRDFEMQMTLVTQAQYFLTMGHNPSFFSSRSYCANDFVEINGASLCSNNPAEQVSWSDTQDFINKLNAIDVNYSYRLPTEAELEYSIRAGTRSAFWFGNNAENIGDYVWLYDNSGEQTHAVGTKPANPWGLYDATGNVGQWAFDWYGDYPSSHQRDPVGARSGTFRVVRGGGWNNGAPFFRSSYRNLDDFDGRSIIVGFRLARTAK